MRSKGIMAAALAAGISAPVMAGSNAVNLSLQLETPGFVNVCETVRIQVMATSTTGDVDISGYATLFGWDPEFLEFTGVDNTSSAILSSLVDPDPWGINEAMPPADGTGHIAGLLSPVQPVTVNTEGVLVATLEFVALQATGNTPVQLFDSLESSIKIPATSVVYQANDGAQIVGNLTGTSVSAVGLGDCGNEPDPCPWDLTGDDSINVLDLVALISAWGTDDAEADLDGSGLVDVPDLIAMITNWGECPAE